MQRLITATAIIMTLTMAGACGRPSKPQATNAGPTPYDGIRWPPEALNDEINACRSRETEPQGLEAARVFCKCIYIGLSQMSTYESFTGDRQKISDLFREKNGDKDCEKWLARKTQIDAETFGHGLYPADNGQWRDIFTSKLYNYYELFY